MKEEVKEEVKEELEAVIEDQKFKLDTEEENQDLDGYSPEQIKQITSDINCENFIIKQNKIYCWDGKKFNLYKK